MTVIAGFLLAALSFPLMPMKRWLPRRPPAERVAWEDGYTWTHYAINLWVEWLRADPQWWGKCLAFLLVVAVIL